ncbi:hypothetical protein [Prevotella aff. ruminicola Tc2-24]|uniref:hypothetical protein n=1 Tax=Prevotella aff. ruminicola Tc2-24 TaxID=81582 RepID=UPI000B82E1EF|nr:hypothetical protein [Prevotella aff. ruminicola Tc2-24]
MTGSVDVASHTYVSEGKIEWDEELKMNCFVSVRVDANKALVDRLRIVENQAKINYGKRIK